MEFTLTTFYTYKKDLDRKVMNIDYVIRHRLVSRPY